MNPSSKFISLWLTEDTHINDITPTQYRRIRKLCNKFYEAGKRDSEEKFNGRQEPLPRLRRRA